MPATPVSGAGAKRKASKGSSTKKAKKGKGTPTRSLAKTFDKTGDDGSEKLQMRIDLGLLQMNSQFRPDGKRPFGHPTLLDHFLLRLQKHRNKNGGEDDDFSINSDECAKLQQEAIQFHHRSICNFELNDFEAVERDTDHILELLDFVQDYAAQEEIGSSFQQFRPQTIMMQTRARAMIVLDDEDYPAAMRAVEEGIQHIEQFVEEWESELEEDLPEISFLREWLAELEQERPLSQREQLERCRLEARAGWLGLGLGLGS